MRNFQCIPNALLLAVTRRFYWMRPCGYRAWPSICACIGALRQRTSILSRPIDYRHVSMRSCIFEAHNSSHSIVFAYVDADHSCVFIMLISEALYTCMRIAAVSPALKLPEVGTSPQALRSDRGSLRNCICAS